MNAMWSEARVKVSHRLAMHLHVDLFRLRNATPMVSFTFDDLPKSAVTTGAGLLEAHGARGTFYVSGGLVGVGTPQWETGDSSDVLALHRSGHEIGCHTFSHQRACDLDETSLAEEIARNRNYFRALDPANRDRYLRLSVRLRLVRAQAAAQIHIPDLPQHRARRQLAAASICSSCAPCR